MTGNIYSLNCPHTNIPKYIGQTRRTLYERLRSHKSQLKKTDKRTKWIASLMEKGTPPVIELVHECPIEEIDFWESHYISLYRSWGFDLKNLTLGGQSGGPPSLESRIKMRNAKLGTKQSPETIKKRSAGLIGNKNGLGYRHTEEAKRKIVENRKSLAWSEESKRKISATKKGVPMTEKHRESLRRYWENKKKK